MQLNKIFTKFEYIFLFAIILLGFLVRLYRFNNPIADWHSWRQADTSAVSRTFVSQGFDLLHPRGIDVSNVASGLDNPNAYRFVEFPIYNVFQAGLYKIFGVFSLEQWGRLVSIFASIFSSIFIFFILRKRFGKLAAFLSSFFFLFLPFNIYYSRTILPDTSMVTASLGSIYFFQKWLEKDKPMVLNFLLSFIFLAAALLLKPYALFFTLPLIYLSYEKFGVGFLKKWKLWLFLTISVIPLALWRIWILKYPEGIPASDWLLNGGNIRFTGAYFYWIFADRIGRLILGYFGVVFLILGFLAKQEKKNLFFLISFVFSSLIYLVVIARGNVQHDYYQILIIPSMSILLGIGASYLLTSFKDASIYMRYVMFFIVLLFTISFSWYFVRDYFNVNDNSIVLAGAAVDKLTPQNVKVIANYNGDTSFLYQTKRQGWASFEKPLPEMIRMGASYLVLVNPTPIDLGLGKTYRIIVSNKDYVIFNLNQKP